MQIYRECGTYHSLRFDIIALGGAIRGHHDDQKKAFKGRNRRHACAS